MKKSIFILFSIFFVFFIGFIGSYGHENQVNPANPKGEIFLKKDKISQKQYEYLNEVLKDERDEIIIKEAIERQIKAFNKGIEDPVDDLGNVVPFVEFKVKRSEEIQYYNSLLDKKIRVEWPPSKQGDKIEGYITNVGIDEARNQVTIYIIRLPDGEEFSILNQLWAPFYDFYKKENENRLNENAKFIILQSDGYKKEKAKIELQKAKIRQQKIKAEAEAAAAEKAAKEKAQLEQENKISYDSKEFIVQGLKYEGNFISGRLINKTNKTYTFVMITFSLYNSNHEQVGTANDILNGFDAYGVWRFKAYVFQSDAMTCKIKEIIAR